MKIDPLKDPITFIEEAAYSIRILFQKQFEESSDLEKIGIYLTMYIFMKKQIQIEI